MDVGLTAGQENLDRGALIGSDHQQPTDCRNGAQLRQLVNGPLEDAVPQPPQWIRRGGRSGQHGGNRQQTQEPGS